MSNDLRDPVGSNEMRRDFDRRVQLRLRVLVPTVDTGSELVSCLDELGFWVCAFEGGNPPAPAGFNMPGLSSSMPIEYSDRRVLPFQELGPACHATTSNETS